MVSMYSCSTVQPVYILTGGLIVTDVTKPFLTAAVCMDLILSLQQHIIQWPQHATLRFADQKPKLSP